jgi:hypothetical protein
MAGFDVVEHPLRTIWAPVDYTNSTAQTLYVGQLVAMAGVVLSKGPGVSAYTSTTAPLAYRPFGVVVGTNNKEPLFDSTYKAEYIVSVKSQSEQLARKNSLGGDGGGMFHPAETQAMVKVAVIGFDTVLKGRIFTSAYGTAPTEAVASATSSDGLGITCATTGFDTTNIAYESLFYCRKGLNAGLYRGNAYDTAAGTAAKTLYGPAFPYDIAIGDKFVGVNFSLGNTLMPFSQTGLWVSTSTATSTYQQRVNVLEVNLENKGSEYVIFQFGAGYNA